VTGPVPDSWAIDRSAATAAELRPGLWRLRLPTAWPVLSHVNAYLLERVDGLALVDCGCGGDPSGLDSLAAAVASTDWSLDDVRELVLTHYHTDHAGSAARLVETVGCTVTGHPAVAHAFAAWCDRDAVYAERLREARLDGVPADWLEAFATLDEELTGYDGPVVPDRLLADGACVDSVLGPWRAIESPGHAPSHVILVNDAERLAFVGDLLAPAFTAWYDLGHTPDPVAELVASLRAVRALGPLTALPGHGRPFSRTDEVATSFLTEVERGVEAALRVIAGAPATVHEVATRLHPEAVEPRRRVWAGVVVKGHLRHLVATGRAAAGPGDDGALRYRRVG
jgi:glyoxylase-like metal-dependent hydrolase (beta-lactamase superfamily II)